LQVQVLHPPPELDDECSPDTQLQVQDAPAGSGAPQGNVNVTTWPSSFLCVY
jgi:hypothetical protein